MTKMDLPYLWLPKGRNGRQYAYYRRAGLRLKINAPIGTAAFIDRYNQIHQGFEQEKALDGKANAGSMAALIKHYRQSPEYQSLKPATKREYDRVLQWLDERVGQEQAAKLPRVFVIRARDDNADSPSRANKILATLKVLMNYAIQLEWRTDNPCNQVKKLKQKGEGARRWSESEIALFRKQAKPHMRLAFELGLNTGQRANDIARLKWSDFDGKGIGLRQQKTGAKLYIPCTQPLIKMLKKTQKTAITIITGEKGQPFTHASSFPHSFSKECKRIGLNGVSFHGLRKTAASVLAELGCSDREIMAITGHTTPAMVTHYTRQAEQKKQAEAAIIRLEQKEKCKTSQK